MGGGNLVCEIFVYEIWCYSEVGSICFLTYLYWRDVAARPEINGLVLDCKTLRLHGVSE